MNLQKTTIGEIVKYRKGKKPSTLFEEKKDDLLPYLITSSVKRGVYKYFAVHTDKTILVNKNDIIFVWDGSCGDVFIGYEGILASTMIKIELTTPKLDIKYLYYFLLLNSELFKKTVTGSTIPHVNKSVFLSLEIDFPPIEIQRDIVNILTNIDNAVKLKKKIQTLNFDLIMSIFHEMFGDPRGNPKKWKEGVLGDLLSDIRYGVSIKSGSAGYPIVGMNSISYAGFINWENLAKVELSEEDFHKEKVEMNDLLFNRTNSPELIGKTGIVTSRVKAVPASYLIRLKIKKEYNPYFVWALMNTPFYKAIFFQKCKKAVNQANINSKELSSFPAYIPDSNLQNEFANIVKLIKFNINNQKKTLNSLTNLFEQTLSYLLKEQFINFEEK